MEKIQLNPLQIAANHESQTNDVRRLISKLQSTPQKGDNIAPLLTAMYDIPPGIARFVTVSTSTGIRSMPHWKVCI